MSTKKESQPLSLSPRLKLKGCDPFVMGLAILAVLLFATDASAQRREPTPESGIGVWYQPDAPQTRELWQRGDAGERLLLRGRVLNTKGERLSGARVEIWHVDAQGTMHAERFRSTLISDRDGKFRLSTVLPGYIWGPRHIHVMVTHPQQEMLITRLFFKRDPQLAGSERPDLAIILEDGRYQDAPVLFGDVELVLK